MLDSLVQSIENTFVQFSLRRLFYVAFLIIIVFGAVFIFDRSTGYSANKKLEMRLTALERLSALESRGIGKSPTLAPLYSSTLAELRDAPTSKLAWTFDSEPLVKFVAAAFMPLIFIGWGLISMAKGTEGAGSTFGGALVAALMLGVPAMYLPTWGSLRATAFGLFAVQALLMWLMVRYYSAKP